MELRRVADALLRSQSSPLSILLAPSATARWTTSRQLRYRAPSSQPTRRPITTTIPRYAVPRRLTTASPPPATPSEEPTASFSAMQPRKEPELDIHDLSNSLNWASRPSPRERSHFSPTSEDQEKRLNGGIATEDLFRSFMKQKKKQFTDVSATPWTDAMLDPKNASGQNVMKTVSANLTYKPERPTLKLNPSTGRTVAIQAKVDLARGIRLLEMSCAKNKIKSGSFAQRFHERGGKKRKRLRALRWRRKFLEGFRATVGRVKQLRNQGW